MNKQPFTSTVDKLQWIDKIVSSVWVTLSLFIFISFTLDNSVLELRLPKAKEFQAKKIKIEARLHEGETKERLRKLRQKRASIIVR